jgi:predicted protein tyrosine phosphatase
LRTPTIEEGGPTQRDVEALINFARRIGEDGSVLIHCQAGISRSTAAAYIVFAVALGPGREGEAADYVRAAVPEARPNTAMLALAERLLDRPTFREVWSIGGCP